MSEQTNEKKKVSKGLSITIICMMVLGYGIGSAVVGIDLKIITLLIVTVLLIIAKLHGFTMGEIMGDFMNSVKGMAPVFMIFLAIGALIAAFMMAGTGPVLVCWLTYLVSPKYILLLSFILTSVLSFCIGSSFATMGTIGILMFTAAMVQGVPAPYVAAAVITGSNFGGLCSPFNDSKTAAAGMYKMNILDFLQKPLVTACMAAVVTSVIYLFIGFQNSASQAGGVEVIEEFRDMVYTYFNSNPLVILPLVVALVLAFKKVDVIVNLFLCSFIGVIIGVVIQGFDVVLCLNALANGFSASKFFGQEEVPEMLTVLTDRGGMSSMGGSVLFVLLILAMGALIKQLQVFKFISELKVFGSSKFGVLNLCALPIATLIALVTTESLPTLLITRDLFEEKYKAAGIDPCCIGHASISATVWVTNWLPWCFCANYFSGVLGVEVWSWLPYTFFFFAEYVFCIILAFTGITRVKLRDEWAGQED